MGRKGVSKRKPVQTKSKLISSSSNDGSMASLMKTTEIQPVKNRDAGLAASSSKGFNKDKSAGRKNGRKG